MMGVQQDTALLALGANLGDPLSAVAGAVRVLGAKLGDVRCSSAYRTDPEGGACQPPYVNAVVRGTWSGTAHGLLSLSHMLEDAAGRTRPFPGAARTLDVDVIFLGGLVLDEADLTIPHPRWANRDFVVVPLLQVAGDWVDARSGRSVTSVARERGWTTASLEEVLTARQLASWR